MKRSCSDSNSPRQNYGGRGRWFESIAAHEIARGGFSEGRLDGV